VQIHELSFSWFGTGTSIKSGGVKLALWTQTSLISELMQTQTSLISELMQTQTSLISELIGPKHP
jgi:hypothetical protein